MATKIKATGGTFKSKMDKIRKHFNESGGGGSNDKQWFNVKAPERGGETKAIIRVLPPWGKSAEGFFYYTERQHFGFSIGGRNRAISCSESVGRGPCPVCKFIARLKNSDDSGHNKLADRLRGNTRFFVNIIDREEPDAIKIYGTNKKFIEAILDASDDSDIGDVTDARTGHDITIIRRGSGLKTRYNYRIRTKPSPVTYDPKDMYELDKEVSEWMKYEDIITYIKENFSEEVHELGMKFGKKTKTKVVKEEADEESDDADDSDEEIEEEVEESEELDEEDTEEESDEESDEDEVDEDEEEE